MKINTGILACGWVVFLTTGSTFAQNFLHDDIYAKQIYFNPYVSTTWGISWVPAKNWTISNGTRSSGLVRWDNDLSGNAYTESYVEQYRSGGHFAEGDHIVEDNQWGNVNYDFWIKAFDETSGVKSADLWAEIEDTVLEGRLVGSLWDWTYYIGTTYVDHGDQKATLDVLKSRNGVNDDALYWSWTIVDVETTVTGTRRFLAQATISP